MRHLFLMDIVTSVSIFEVSIHKLRISTFSLSVIWCDNFSGNFTCFAMMLQWWTRCYCCISLESRTYLDVSASSRWTCSLLHFFKLYWDICNCMRDCPWKCSPFFLACCLYCLILAINVGSVTFFYGWTLLS